MRVGERATNQRPMQNLENYSRPQSANNTHPIADPTAQGTCNRAKASALFVSSVISPIALLIVPPLLLNAAKIHRLVSFRE